MDIVLLIGRILFGGYFLLAGLNHFKNKEMLISYASTKGVKRPKFAVLFSGLLIVLGGLGVILGFYADIALILIAVFLFVVTLKMHNYWKITDANAAFAEKLHFQKNVAMFGAALALYALSGGWAYSLILG